MIQIQGLSLSTDFGRNRARDFTANWQQVLSVGAVHLVDAHTLLVPL